MNMVTLAVVKAEKWKDGACFVEGFSWFYLNWILFEGSHNSDGTA